MHQQKFAHLLFIKRSARTHLLPRKSRRLRSSITIKRSVFQVAATGPPARTDHLMRISFLHDLAQNRIGIIARWCRTAGKTRDSQVKTAPEEMCRARFADEARAENVEHIVNRHQSAPEAPGIFLVVGGVYVVLIESNGIGDLHRHLPDFYVNVERMKR